LSAPVYDYDTERVQAQWLELAAGLFGVAVGFYLGIRTASGAGSPLLNLILLAFVYVGIAAVRYIAPLIEQRLGTGATLNLVLRAGRGIPRQYIRMRTIALEVGILLLFVGVSIAGSGAVPRAIGVLVVVIGALLIVGATLSARLLATVMVQTRQYSVEVELPFLLAMLKALSTTHLTLYDLINILANSEALKAWRKEVRLAIRWAAATGTSLIEALRVIARNHPSPIVRDVFLRIINIGTLAGTIRDVVERSFNYIYTKLESGLERATEQIQVVLPATGTAFILLPIVLASAAPLASYPPETIVGGSLAIYLMVAVVTSFLLTAIIHEGFIVHPDRTLKIMMAVAGILAAGALYFYVRPTIRGEGEPVPFFYVPIIVAIVFAAPTVYAETILRKAKPYDKFIRVASDASELSLSLGVNFASALDEIARRAGSDVHRLVRRVVESYQNAVFSRAIVAQAPTLFHAAFIETVLVAMRVGAGAQVVKALAESYEKLLNLSEKMKGSALMLEFLTYLSAVIVPGVIVFLIGFFEPLTGMLDMLPMTITVVNISPTTKPALLVSGLIATLFLALLVGKARAGSITYGARTVVIASLLYAATTYAAQAILPSLMSGLPTLP